MLLTDNVKILKNRKILLHLCKKYSVCVLVCTYNKTEDSIILKKTKSNEKKILVCHLKVGNEKQENARKYEVDSECGYL